MKMDQKKLEKWICAAGLTGLTFLLLARLIMAFRSAEFIDLRVWRGTVELILQHISPYGTPEYAAYHFPAPPIQSPSMSALMMIFAPLSLAAAKIVFFISGFLAMAGCFFLVIKQRKLYAGTSFFSLGYTNLPLWIVAFLLLQSSPLLTMLRHGQVTSIVWLLMLTVLFCVKQEKWNWLWLALAAALKYSLLPMTAPLLLFQKRIVICVAGFLLFVVLVLLPGLWLDGVVPGFRAYLDMLREDMLSGSDSYAKGSSFCMLQFDFFKIHAINLFFKLLLLCAAVVLLWRSRARIEPGEKILLPLRFTMTELGFLAGVTICISYHRNYDAVIFLPFLFAVTAQNLLGRNRLAAAFGLLFTLFWAAPMDAIYRLSNLVGQVLSGLEPIFYYSRYQGMTQMFPLSNIVLFAMTVYFLMLAWQEKTSEKD